MTPGFPVHDFSLDDYDPDRCAEWMLGLIDDSPDKLAIVKMPPHQDDDDLDQLEALFSTAYDIAKAAAPEPEREDAARRRDHPRPAARPGRGRRARTLLGRRDVRQRLPRHEEGGLMTVVPLVPPELTLPYEAA